MRTKRFICVIALVSLIYITSASIIVKAHNPADVGLEYDSNSELLVVTISHGVSDPSSHYVESVSITVNGSLMLAESYGSQPSSSVFIYMYNITANDGARIQVTAICNVGGSKTGCIIVGTGRCNQAGGIPAYSGILMILGFSTIILSMITYKNIKKRLN